MINEPPLLRIAARKHRVLSDADMAPFRDTLTGNICDALGGMGAMHHRIKPITPATPRMIGQALTVDCGPADILAFTASFTQVLPGEVLVVATSNHTDCAAMGDMTCGMAKNCGAAGVVSDGMVRDADGIRALGLPVYAQGINPNSPFGNGPGSIGFKINLGGLQVGAGDLIIGDEEGVVVVPLERIDEVSAALAEVKAAETILEAKVRDGLKFAPEMRTLVDGPRCVKN